MIHKLMEKFAATTAEDKSSSSSNYITYIAGSCSVLCCIIAIIFMFLYFTKSCE